MPLSATRRDILRGLTRMAVAAPALSVLACSEEQSPDRLTTLRGETMGTTFTVKITDLPPRVKQGALSSEIDLTLRRINRLMSTYRADSEISRFNAHGTDSWMDLSGETRLVVDQALQVSRLTGGAFDPTVGPLVNLWGFGPAGSRIRAPAPEQIAERLVHTGYRNLVSRKSSPALRKMEADMQIDLSGIAKGFAVDELAALLERARISDFLVEIGGELRGRGLNAKGQPWMVGIERPPAGQAAIQKIVRLDGSALATSGDYRNYFVQDGERLSHLIDPRSGKPVAQGLASVTVIAGSTMEADALSTALMVLGPEAGMKLANRENIAALFLVPQRDNFAEVSTGAFHRYVVA